MAWRSLMVSNYRSKSMEERKNFPPLWLQLYYIVATTLCQKSCDTNAIARQNDAPLPQSRRCSVDCMDSSFFFFSAQSKLLSREGDIRNRLLQKHSQALRRSRIRIHFAKCVSAPIFLKGTKGVFNRVVALGYLYTAANSLFLLIIC